MIRLVNMADGNEYSRKKLLEQISKASSEEEISEAEKAANLYLQDYPNDPDVLAAKEKLDERAEKARDPERKNGLGELLSFFLDF